MMICGREDDVGSGEVPFKGVNSLRASPKCV